MSVDLKSTLVDGLFGRFRLAAGVYPSEQCCTCSAEAFPRGPTMTVIEAFAVVRLTGEEPWACDLQGRALARGVQIGTGRVRYYDANGRAVGTAEREGATIVLRDTRGQAVQRIRSGKGL